jgi:hypothetical protein
VLALVIYVPSERAVVSDVNAEEGYVLVVALTGGAEYVPPGHPKHMLDPSS